MKLSLRGRNMLTGFLFVLPWLLGFAAFTLYPLYETAYLSLHKVRITGEGIQTAWVGIENYRTIFVMDVTFINALMGYLRELVVYVPMIVVFSLVIAMLLNTRIRGVGIFRTIFFLPVIIASGPVLNYLQANGALHLPGNAALLNAIRNLGAFPDSVVEALSFLMNSFVGILWNSGLQILIFLAALQKIDHSMIEAAQIDGASKWEIFWKLILTHLNPMIVLNVLFTIIMHSVFSLNPIIEKIRVDLYLPERGFGYGAALSWIYFVLLVMVIGLSVLIVRSREGRQKHA